jgi:hypothetical protein
MENFVFIDEFKRGPEHIIKSHIFSADNVRREIYTNNIEISEKELKKIDNILSQIIELSDEAILSLDKDKLDEESRKEYRNFFPEDYEIKLEKINFLILKKTYEILKKYNNKIERLWDEIRYILEKNKNPNNKEAIEEILRTQIENRIEFVKEADKLLQMLYDYLKIKKEHVDKYTGEISTNPIYDENIDYSYYAIFDIMRKESSHTKENERKTITEIEDKPIKKIESDYEFHIPSDKKYDILRSIGKYPWNSGKEYELIIELKKLSADVERIKNAIAILEKTYSREEIERLIRRKFLLRTKIDPKKNLKEYRAFSKIKILNIYTKLQEFFGIMLEDMPLFLFHLGPLSYFAIIREHLERNQVGFILYVLPNKRRDIAKYMPLEFVKNEVKRFWELELLPLLSSDIINDKQSYLRIYNIIKAKYMLDRNKLFQKLGKVMQGSDISINRVMKNELPIEKFFVFRRFGLLGSEN